MTDDRGNPIAAGDTVCVVMNDSSRGAYRWMWHGTVIGFGRTRVRVTFPSYDGSYLIGPECLRIVTR